MFLQIDSPTTDAIVQEMLVPSNYLDAHASRLANKLTHTKTLVQTNPRTHTCTHTHKQTDTRAHKTIC